MKTEIIPVIHKVNFDQIIKNVETCISCGIKKVFLIDHNMDSFKHERLANDCAEVKRRTGIWVGANFLGLETNDALMSNYPIDGLWCDGSVEANGALERNFNGQFFGGLAFKYQPQPTDLKAACDYARITTDVATTSGPGTGKAATVTKIQQLRSFLGNHPMAIASGVSVENVKSYAGLAEYLLVATSITGYGELIVKEKLKKLKEELETVSQ